MQRIMPLTKVFNGKRYRFHLGYSSKRKWQEAKKHLGTMGFLIRTATSPAARGWRFLYIRSKPKGRR